MPEQHTETSLPLTPHALAAQIAALVAQARQLPPSRELSLVITKLQEASLWLTALYAVQEDASNANKDA